MSARSRNGKTGDRNLDQALDPTEAQTDGEMQYERGYVVQHADIVHQGFRASSLGVAGWGAGGGGGASGRYIHRPEGGGTSCGGGSRMVGGASTSAAGACIAPSLRFIATGSVILSILLISGHHDDILIYGERRKALVGMRLWLH